MDSYADLSSIDALDMNQTKHESNTNIENLAKELELRLSQYNLNKIKMGAEESDV